jgi:hypothetical protein
MADDLRNTLPSFGIDLQISVVKHTLTMLVHAFVACGDLPSGALNFKSSRNDTERFLKRTGLSFRSQPTRRPALDEEECDYFILTFQICLEIFAPEVVVNLDESHGGNAKASVTFFACVTASGTKLPLALIAKGRTPRCHKQPGVHPVSVHEIWELQLFQFHRVC